MDERTAQLLGRLLMTGSMQGAPEPGVQDSTPGMMLPPVPIKTGDEIRRETAQVKQRQTERAATVKALARSGSSIRMQDATGRHALVGPDMSEPGKFRITRFDDAGAPFNHNTYNTYNDAIENALYEKFAPVEKMLPIARALLEGQR